MELYGFGVFVPTRMNEWMDGVIGQPPLTTMPIITVHACSIRNGSKLIVPAH